VATIADDGFLLVWDADRQAVISAHGCVEESVAGRGFVACAFLDTQRLVAGTAEQIHVFDARSGDVQATWDHDGSRLLHLGDDRLLCPLAGESDNFEIISLVDGRVLWQLPPQPDIQRLDPIGFHRGSGILVFLVTTSIWPRDQSLIGIDIREHAERGIVWRRGLDHDLEHEVAVCLGGDQVATITQAEHSTMELLNVQDGSVQLIHVLPMPRWELDMPLSWSESRAQFCIRSHVKDTFIDPASGEVTREPSEPVVHFDLWHRDHQDDRPACIAPLAHGGGFGIKSPPDDRPVAVALSEDGRYALVAIGDGRLLHWDLVQRRLVDRKRLFSIDTYSGPGWYRPLCTAVDRSGRHMVVADQTGVISWLNASLIDEVAVIHTGLSAIGDLAIVAGGVAVACGDGIYGREPGLMLFGHDGRLRWQRDDLARFGKMCDDGAGGLLLPCCDHLLRVAIEDGRDLGEPQRLNVHSSRHGIVAAEYLEGPVQIASLSRVLVIGGSGSPLYYDLNSPDSGRYAPIRYDGVSAVALSPDGSLVAVAECYHNDLTIWDARTDQSRTLSGHLNRATALAMSRDSNRLISASPDGQLIVWDLQANRPLEIYRCLYTPLGEQQRWEVIRCDGGPGSADRPN
jgi:WD40 repeat protein